MTKWVAFLRGINVGGKRRVPMEDLRRQFASLGFQNVKTYIASGNVVFEAAESNRKVLRGKIEAKLEHAFGFEIKVILRAFTELGKLIESDPFAGINVAENVRLYVAFFADRISSKLKLPHESPGKDFKVLNRSDREVFSVLFLSPTGRTVDEMMFIEKEFGRACTTRNWNTVKKIAAL